MNRYVTEYLETLSESYVYHKEASIASNFLKSLQLGPGTAIGAAGGGAGGALMGYMRPGMEVSEDGEAWIVKNRVKEAIKKGLIGLAVGGTAGFGYDNRSQIKGLFTGEMGGPTPQAPPKPPQAPPKPSAAPEKGKTPDKAPKPSAAKPEPPAAPKELEPEADARRTTTPSDMGPAPTAPGEKAPEKPKSEQTKEYWRERDELHKKLKEIMEEASSQVPSAAIRGLGTLLTGIGATSR